MGEVTKVDTHSEAVPPAGSQPSPEAAAKMAQQAKVGVTKVEATTTPSDPKTERPAWLPEKFKTVEDLAKSYTELEKKQGAKANEPKAPVTPEPVVGEKKGLEALKLPDKATTEDATKALAAGGLKMEEFQAEFAKEGKLGDESYSKLEKGGIPKAMVDAFIAGQQAIMEKSMADLHSVAGSEDKFNEMFEWSKTAESLSESDRAAVSKAIDSNDHAAVKLAFKAVHAAWIADIGSEPKAQLRGGTGGGKGDVYSSMQDVVLDMGKPEYEKSPQFRADVQAKIKRSNKL